MELEELNLQDTSLTTDQVYAMADFMIQPGKLRKLILARNDLSEVDGLVLSLMVPDLVNLDLGRTKLCKAQAEADCGITGKVKEACVGRH